MYVFVCVRSRGGFIIGEEDQKHGLIKRTDQSNNCGIEPLIHEQMVSSVATHTAATGFHDQHHQAQSHGPSSWTQNSTVLQASSPRSCVTTSLSTHSMLDFSAKRRHKLPADHNNSSEVIINYSSGRSYENSLFLKLVMHNFRETAQKLLQL